MKSSRNVFITAVSVILLISAASGATAAYLDSTRSRAVRQVHDALFNDRFDRADSIATAMLERYPEEPLGYLLRSATLVGRMTATEQDLYPEELSRLVDTTVALAQKIADTASPEVEAWMMLLMGEAVAYRAVRESHFGSVTSAIGNALDSRGYYERGLECDSTLYDLYLGLGLYHYWKSVKAGPLRWLGIFSDDIERGIDEIYVAADSARLLSRLARSSLIYVWEHREEYDSVIAICREFINRYPHGSHLLWPLANAHFQTENYQAALNTYRRLRSRLEQDAGNYHNLVECDYRIHDCLSEMGQEDKAQAVARRLRDYVERIPHATRIELRGKIAFLKREAER